MGLGSKEESGHLLGTSDISAPASKLVESPKKAVVVLLLRRAANKERPRILSGTVEKILDENASESHSIGVVIIGRKKAAPRISSLLNRRESPDDAVLR
jgi:hypothetical protein